MLERHTFMDKPVRLCSRSEPLHASIWPTAFKLGLQFKEELFVTNLEKKKEKEQAPKALEPFAQEPGEECACLCVCLKLSICITQGSAQFGAGGMSCILLSIMHVYGTI